MKSIFFYVKSFVGVFAMCSVLSACGPAATSSGSGSSSADDSASGAAASAAGGALSGSSSGGTQAMYRLKAQDPVRSLWAVIGRAVQPSMANASNFCPTFATTGTGCSVSGSDMWLSYSDCTFAGIANWTGVQEISMSSGTAACGTFPNPGHNGTLYRQFVQSSGASSPGTISLAADNWTAVIDDSTANLNNFDGDTISHVVNGGYGAAVTFDNTGARSSITLAHHEYVTGVFDHSVTGNLTISETAGANTRTITGNVSVYHNLLKVIGTATFNSVVHEDMCCLPVSGSISTVFSAGTNHSPTALGALLVGKTETLTFTGCGTATYTDTAGATSNVILHRCF